MSADQEPPKAFDNPYNSDTHEPQRNSIVSTDSPKPNPRGGNVNKVELNVMVGPKKSKKLIWIVTHMNPKKD